jgi:hypothetical protein
MVILDSDMSKREGHVQAKIVISLENPRSPTTSAKPTTPLYRNDAQANRDILQNHQKIFFQEGKGTTARKASYRVMANHHILSSSSIRSFPSVVLSSNALHYRNRILELPGHA